MLEFIVLGEVPGTSFIITFSWVVALATLVVGAGLFRRAHRPQQTNSATVEEITI